VRKVEDVFRSVLNWEDEHRDGVNRGMTEFNVQQKMAVLLRLVTKPMKEQLLLHGVETNYDQARIKIMEWAVVKARDAQKIKDIAQKNKNAMTTSLPIAAPENDDYLLNTYGGDGQQYQE
jgi:hypothetical protein